LKFQSLFVKTIPTDNQEKDGQRKLKTKTDEANEGKKTANSHVSDGATEMANNRFKPGFNTQATRGESFRT